MRLALFALVTAVLATTAHAAPKTLPYGAFSFDVPVTLPGTPTEIFDAATGDISG